MEKGKFIVEWRGLWLLSISRVTDTDTGKSRRYQLWKQCLAGLLVILGIFGMPLVQASTVTPLYSSEYQLNYDPSASAWVIDRFGDATGDLVLRFGSVATQSIKFDVTNNQFAFGSDVSLGQKQIKNAAIDNRATAPASPVAGQIYFNTTDKQTYVWDGTQWKNITTSHIQNTDTGTTSTTFTLGQGSPTSATQLVFNSVSGNSLTWDITNSRFTFNGPLRVEGNEAIVGQAFIAANHTNAASDGILNVGRLGSVWQTIAFDATSGLFKTSKGLSVGGNASIDGNVFTMDADNTGAGANVSIVANQGTNAAGTLRYNATTKQWEISNNGGTFSPIGVGYSTLFAQATASILACPAGGYVFTSGLDSNRNGVLDASEVATTATVCNGVGTGIGNGNGNTNSGGGGTLAGTCIVTRTASYSNSAQYSVALSGMVSYTDNTLEVTFQNGTYISSISDNNGGASSWSNPNYVLSILGSAQNIMFYPQYTGTPPAGQTPYAVAAKITKFGNTLNCTVVNN